MIRNITNNGREPWSPIVGFTASTKRDVSLIMPLGPTGQFPLLGAPPFGLGEEAAGEVVAVPEGSRFAVGDQVTGIAAFLDGWGGYAEYTYLREESTMRIPPGMTDTQAAGFTIAFRTAYAALVHRVPVSRGQRLAVLGAAGSSGVAALQLGRARGPR